jgi:hypothetical protein
MESSISVEKRMHDIHQRQPGRERPSRQGVKFVDMSSHSGRVTSAKLRSDAVMIDTSKGKEPWNS